MLEYRITITGFYTLEHMCMSRQQQNSMAKTRALLTETDREYITGDEGDEKRYQSASRIRRRLREELPRDLEVLEEHHPELLKELRDVVCEDRPEGGDEEE